MSGGMILHPKIAHACGNLPNADRCFCRYKGDALTTNHPSTCQHGSLSGSYPKALRARCKSTSTQSSNNNDGVPLALTLANWFRGSHIGNVMSTPEGSVA